MNCNRNDCLHYEVCREWKTLGNENYINESNRKCDFYKQRQEPALDKISEEVNALKNYSYPFSDMLLNDVQKIINKYKVESEVTI